LLIVRRYHLPSHIKEHVDFITPGLKLLAGGSGHPKKHVDKRGFRSSASTKFSGPVLGAQLTQAQMALLNATTDPLALCDTMITPPCIAAMYNITQATKAAPDNQLGIFEEGDFYSETDNALFFALFAGNIPVTTMPKLEGIDGGFAPAPYAGGESDLDFQISYPIMSVFYASLQMILASLFHSEHG